jgi:hypothetical protein
MKRVVDIEVTASGGATEEIELICTVTGFGDGFLVHCLGEELFHSMELESRYQENSARASRESSGNRSPDRHKL